MVSVLSFQKQKVEKNYLNLDLGRIVSDVESRHSCFLKGHLKHNNNNSRAFHN